MHTKEVTTHVRIRYEPNFKQKGRKCRLEGKDFSNMEEEERYWKITYAWATEQVNK